jgi:gas vesicle protein
MTKGKFAIGALLGAAAGFVAGILTAPKSGKETREDIKDTAVKAKNTAVEKANVAKKKAGDKAEVFVGKAGKFAGNVADKVSDSAKDFTKDTKETINKNK